MSGTPTPLSYAQPAADDPRLRRWGTASVIVGLLSVMLNLGALGWVGLRFHQARALAASETTSLLYRDPALLAQPDGVRFGLVCSLLLAAMLLAGRLVVMGVRVVRGRPGTDAWSGWARWRIALSLLLPIPAMLLGANLHAVIEQRVKVGDLLDARIVVGGLLTALAWVELVMPIVVLRRWRE